MSARQKIFWIVMFGILLLILNAGVSVATGDLVLTDFVDSDMPEGWLSENLDIVYECDRGDEFGYLEISYEPVEQLGWFRKQYVNPPLDLTQHSKLRFRVYGDGSRLRFSPWLIYQDNSGDHLFVPPAPTWYQIEHAGWKEYEIDLRGYWYSHSFATEPFSKNYGAPITDAELEGIVYVQFQMELQMAIPKEFVRFGDIRFGK